MIKKMRVRVALRSKTGSTLLKSVFEHFYGTCHEEPETSTTLECYQDVKF